MANRMNTAATNESRLGGYLKDRRTKLDPAAFGDGDLEVIVAARDALAELEPFTAETIEIALRSVLERLGLKPRQGFQPIRVAVTGSKISPGLFESIELLGRDETLARLNAAASAAS